MAAPAAAVADPDAHDAQPRSRIRQPQPRQAPSLDAECGCCHLSRRSRRVSRRPAWGDARGRPDTPLHHVSQAKRYQPLPGQRRHPQRPCLGVPPPGRDADRITKALTTRPRGRSRHTPTGRRRHGPRPVWATSPTLRPSRFSRLPSGHPSSATVSCRGAAPNPTALCGSGAPLGCPRPPVPTLAGGIPHGLDSWEIWRTVKPTDVAIVNRTVSSQSQQRATSEPVCFTPY